MYIYIYIYIFIYTYTHMYTEAMWSCCAQSATGSAPARREAHYYYCYNCYIT